MEANPADFADVSRAQRIIDARRKTGVYRLDRRSYAGVTDVLKALAKPALIPWAARTAAGLVLEDPETYCTPELAAQAIYGASKRAKERGTAVHAHAESGAPLDPELAGYGRAIERFRAMHRPEVLHSEINVYSDTHEYAGTVDEIARLADGDVWLLDYKTREANKPVAVYDESKLQLAAYAAAEFFLDPTGKRLAMPQVDRTAVVLIGADGKANLIETEAPIHVFVALIEVWRWQKGNGR